MPLSQQARPLPLNRDSSDAYDEVLVERAIATFEQQFNKWGVVCFSHTEKTLFEEGVYPVEYTDDYPAPLEKAPPTAFSRSGSIPRGSGI
jgi:hypothetical protein